MTRKELETAFQGKLSRRCFIQRDGEWVLQSKWCVIERVGDYWDIWLCTPLDIAKGLGARKIKNVIRGFNSGPTQPRWTVLTGEAFTRVLDADVILRSVAVAGLFFKRQPSDQQLEVLARGRAARSSPTEPEWDEELAA